MNKYSAKSQSTQHLISAANRKKSFTITTVSFLIVPILIVNPHVGQQKMLIQNIKRRLEIL